MRIRTFGCCLDFNEVDKSKWGTKAAMTGIHVVFVGALFVLDTRLIRETVLHPWKAKAQGQGDLEEFNSELFQGVGDLHKYPWRTSRIGESMRWHKQCQAWSKVSLRYTALYLLLLILCLFQYFYTSGSSPGYVLDVLNLNTGNEADMKRGIDSTSSSASSSASQVTLPVDRPSYGSTSYGTVKGKGPAKIAQMAETIPLYSYTNRTWSCPYCHCWQPPRSKHCHDCEKCVLRFDHHCVWLGTCVGQGNHCRFWWYLFEETILCIWTAVMYIMSISKDVSKAWWYGAIEIIFLLGLLFCLIILLMLLIFHSYLILTNQTTYELIRRRRIHYLRNVPERVHPFSKGLLRNIYHFCCSLDKFYIIDSLPTREELEEKARPYTFWDILSCRCC